MEVVFNQWHKSRNAETEAELVGQTDHLFSYSEVKNAFQETIISYNFSDFSKDELSLAIALQLYSTRSLVTADFDPLNLDNEHFLLSSEDGLSSIVMHLLLWPFYTFD